MDDLCAMISVRRFVYVWDSVTQRILYRLPGHLGSVNDVDFHPKEPISKFLHSGLVCFDTSLSSGVLCVQSWCYIEVQ